MSVKRKSKEREVRKTAKQEKQRRRSQSSFVPAPFTAWQQEVYAQKDLKDLFVFDGPPGTGKTFMAVQMALERFVTGRSRKIYLIRAAVEAGEKLGFLPGDINEKLHPYMIPVFEFLKSMGISGQEMLRSGVLEIVPVAFCKGRTFSKSSILVDEAQDLTAKQLRLVLSRFGLDSQMFITGDRHQSDCPETPNAFSRLCAKLEMGDREDYEYVSLPSTEILRHHLVPKLLELCQ